MFTVKGMLHGYPLQASYEWKNGRGLLQGDPVLVTLVKSAAKRKDPTGLPGHWVERNLDDPYSAWFLIRECLDEVIEETGELPECDYGLPADQDGLIL